MARTSFLSRGTEEVKHFLEHAAEKQFSGPAQKPLLHMIQSARAKPAVGLKMGSVVQYLH